MLCEMLSPLRTMVGVFLIAPALIAIHIESNGQQFDAHHYRYRAIKPLPCRNQNDYTDTSGVCMFQYECIQAKGKPVGYCVNSGLVGSCCKLPPIKHQISSSASVSSHFTSNGITKRNESSSTQNSIIDNDLSLMNSSSPTLTTILKTLSSLTTPPTTQSTTLSSSTTQPTSPPPSTSTAIKPESTESQSLTADNATQLLTVQSTQSTMQTTTQSTTLSSTRSSTRSTSQPTTQSISQPTTQSAMPTTTQPTTEPTTQPTTQPNTQPITLLLSQSTTKPTIAPNSTLFSYPYSEVNTSELSSTTAQTTISSPLTSSAPITTSTTSSPPTTTSPTTSPTTSSTTPSTTTTTTASTTSSSTTTPLSTTTSTQIITLTTPIALSSGSILASTATLPISTLLSTISTTFKYPAITSESTNYSTTSVTKKPITHGSKAVCGKRQVAPKGRIVGGTQSSFGEWPWMVSLRQWKKNSFLHKCGAALLNEYWVITAAHCVENVSPTDLLLRLGEYDVSHEKEPYVYIERRVQIIAPHPQFDPRTFEYDLALLRFYEPIHFQRNIIPVCIPDNNDSYIGRWATVTGWGRLYEDGPLPDIMQHVDVPIITNKECEGMYRRAGYIEDIPNIFVCAGLAKGSKDSCEGDSGGPLVIEDDNRWNLVGIISWGIGCALPNQPDCGIRPLRPKGRVVGGRNAHFGEWPWQVLVKEATWLGFFVKTKCGGVLIDYKWVLTAAHCQPGFLGSLVVVLGEYDLTGDIETFKPVAKPVKRMIVHRNYNPNTFENDIALLELESPFEVQPHVLPICLPDPKSYDYVGKVAFVAGWGKLSYGGPIPSILQVVKLPILANSQCQRMFLEAGHVKAIRDTFICAGYTTGGKDSCEGDSGGPLMIPQEDGRWFLVGTVSHGIRCAEPNLPGVYMKTSAYRHWIKSIIKK